MQIYRVGGYVRDWLLGLKPTDCDFVVVGATTDQMLKLGFRQVGKSFPVFLHPQTQEEYALARRESKSGLGYYGFTIISDPTITLEEDLARRDLTINAMALDRNNQLIDPFGGAQDLAKRQLRHVSPAFSDDPLRILRVARFAAKLNFVVAAETMELLQHMASTQEGRLISRERVVSELSKALNEAHSSLFFTVLQQSDNLRVFFPSLAQALASPPLWAELLTALANASTQLEKYAVLAICFAKGSAANQLPHFAELALSTSLIKFMTGCVLIWRLLAVPAQASNWLNGYKQLAVLRDKPQFEQQIASVEHYLTHQANSEQALSSLGKFKLAADNISQIVVANYLHAAMSNQHKAQIVHNLYLQAIEEVIQSPQP
jgi:tRNA nucleotidyltransferase (CCA-adding enzyme)